MIDQEKNPIQKAKQCQWWSCRFTKTKENTFNFDGWWNKGDLGYACVVDESTVILWNGKSFYSIMTIENAKEFATCLHKTTNKASLCIQAFDRAMY